MQAYPYCKRGRESEIPLPEGEKVLFRTNRKPGDFAHVQHPDLWVGRLAFFLLQNFGNSSANGEQTDYPELCENRLPLIS